MGETGKAKYTTVYDTGKELFLGTWESRGIDGVGILAKTNVVTNIGSFEQLNPNRKSTIEEMWINTSLGIIFVAYAPTSSYDEAEVEAFYVDSEKFYRQDRTFHKVIIRDFKSKARLRRMSEERLTLGPTD
ncbi:unnamed protein product [Angiostrongylus costaricensis]|uniref:Lipocln_cytosolic_FA-bd_dom domain-containing protein n=1 Tax=Angiostrongylus costaricensis TaxID=334426 RepID=A0A0R3PBA1_ANGCS|nr:unnamed protein product [Angiostrongylus costaricensis]